MIWNQKQWFEYKQVKSYYVKVGSGPTVLFFHGIGGSPYSYKEIIEPLAESFTVICPQIPPFGEATMPDKIWSYLDYKEYFDFFIDSLNVKKLYVIGHSLGGGIACYVSNNAVVKKVLLINPAIMPTKKSIQKNISSIIFGSAFGKLIGKDTIRLDLIHYFFKNMFSHPLYSYRVIQTLQLCMNSDFMPSLQINVPVFIVRGTKDELLGYPDYFLLKKQLPNMTIQDHEGYHNWCFFDTNAISQYAQKFFN